MPKERISKNFDPIVAAVLNLNKELHYHMKEEKAGKEFLTTSKQNSLSSDAHLMKQEALLERLTKIEEESNDIGKKIGVVSQIVYRSETATGNMKSR